MPNDPAQRTSSRNSPPSRRIDPASGSASGALWLALSQTPGIGVSITDAEGRLLFVNDTTAVLFSGTAGVDYHGKSIADFHPPEFVAERLQLIQRVLSENKPLALHHIYRGQRITSILWPFRDHKPPYHRVLVVSRCGPEAISDPLLPDDIEKATTDFIDLGPLNVLSQRELEVAVLIGHGQSVPQVAATLHRSPKTIERHKESIAKKLCLRSQSELVQTITLMGLELRDTALKRL